MSVLHIDLYSRYEYTYLFQGEQNLKSTKPSFDTYSGRTRMSFFATDLAGLKEEKFVTSVDNHLTRIRFQMSKYSDGNGILHKVLSTWEITADELLSGDGFGRKFTKKSNYGKVWEAAKDVVNPTDSARLKAQKIVRLGQ